MAAAAGKKMVLVAIGNGSEEIEAVTIIDVLVRAGKSLFPVLTVLIRIAQGKVECSTNAGAAHKKLMQLYLLEGDAYADSRCVHYHT